MQRLPRGARLQSCSPGRASSMSRSHPPIPARAPRLSLLRGCRGKTWLIDWRKKPEFHGIRRTGWLANYEETAVAGNLASSDRQAVRPAGRQPHHRPPALRPWRRLVRESLEPAEPPDRVAPADDVAG